MTLTPAQTYARDHTIALETPDDVGGWKPWNRGWWRFERSGEVVADDPARFARTMTRRHDMIIRARDVATGEIFEPTCPYCDDPHGLPYDGECLL